MEGSALWTQCVDNTVCTFTDNVFTANKGTSNDGYTHGGSVYLFGDGVADLRFDDNLIEQSHASGVMFKSFVPTSQGSSLYFQVQGTARIEARRNRIHGQPIDGVIRYDEVVNGEAYLLAKGQGLIVFGDNVVAQSPWQPVVVELSGNGTVDLVNLTLADNHHGVVISGTSTTPAHVSNVLSTAPSGDPDQWADAVLAGNLFGAMPDFVDAVHFNYKLRAGDPAINAGVDAPEGGLGPTDIDGGRRWLGPHPDAGAWEFLDDAVFSNGFDS